MSECIYNILYFVLNSLSTSFLAERDEWIQVTDTYPIFNFYPKFVVDYQIKERERIEAEEQQVSIFSLFVLCILSVKPFILIGKTDGTAPRCDGWTTTAQCHFNHRTTGIMKGCVRRLWMYIFGGNNVFDDHLMFKNISILLLQEWATRQAALLQVCSALV